MTKGNGKFDNPDKTRWIMRFSNGQEMVTTGYYTHAEVSEWECSAPVKPILIPVRESVIKRLATQQERQMTLPTDKVLEIAREAGDVETDERGRITITFDDHGLERFHALAVAAYKCDAERYRWLRDKVQPDDYYEIGVYLDDATDLDAAIDRARSANERD